MVDRMHVFTRFLSTLVGAVLCLTGSVPSFANEPKVIVGKDNWLFFSQEVIGASEEGAIDASIDLVSRLNRILLANGVQLAYALVPAKMRVYADSLPDDAKLPAYMQGNYDRILARLKSNQVRVIDINAAMMQSPLRKTASPVFKKGDTHWSPMGALVAAEAIKKGIVEQPQLDAVYQATPPEKYTMEFQKQLTTLPTGDLASKIPKLAAKMPPEQSLLFDVARSVPIEPRSRANDAAKIALLGSSYSADWTMFADALRFALQRDIFSMSATADKGPWVGLIEAYVSTDKFQASPPRLLIWETVEQELTAPPDFAYRDKQYIRGNTDWLLRVSAWVQRSCKPSASKYVISKTGLASAAQALTDDSIAARSATASDFVELVFDPPATQLDYLSARMASPGSRTLTMEVVGSGGEVSRMVLQAAGDAQEHVFRASLPAGGKGYAKVRLFPGKTDKFSLAQLAVCAQPGDLLN